MVMNELLKRYNEYKDSGVEWLGDVPGHWSVERVKNLFTERSQKGFPEEPLLIASQDMGVTLKSSYSRNTMTVQKDFHLMKLVKKNDYVISLRSFEGGIERATYRGIISAAYTILFPIDEIGTGFYKHLFKSNKFISMLVTCTTGIREGRNVNYQQLKRELLPLPFPAERQQIANYLDTKTEQIDCKIDLLTQKATKYGELKQSLINETVTRGLDKTVEMKDSGVEWIGDVPEHWQVERLKNNIEFSKGINAAIYTQEYIKDEKNFGIYPVYSGQTENEGVMGLINSYEYNFSVPVIFVTTVGAKAMTTQLLRGAFSLSQNCALLKTKSSVDTSYVNYFLLVLFREERRNIPAHMQPSLRIEDLKKHILLVPPPDEQKAIAEYLDTKTVHIDRIVATINTQIEKLKELRKTLINDVVTGKIKVTTEGEAV